MNISSAQSHNVSYQTQLAANTRPKERAENDGDADDASAASTNAASQAAVAANGKLDVQA